MVIIYTTDTCPKCKVLKQKLEAKNIAYQENKDIKEMKKMGIMSVPQILKDNELLEFTEAISWINSL